MYAVDLTGKTAIVFGVANHRSIAWAIAQILHQAGARLIIAYQNDRVRDTVEKLVEKWEGTILVECDVTEDSNVASVYSSIGQEIDTLDIIVHSIAYANKDDLGGAFLETGREGFRLALDISAYSLVPIVKYGAPLMGDDGGSVIAMTFQASTHVFPGYYVMGTAKAALENEVKQLASDLGLSNVRVNAISAGPLDTLSSRVISRYRDMKRVHA